jgi:hypothetical protein
MVVIFVIWLLKYEQDFHFLCQRIYSELMTKEISVLSAIKKLDFVINIEKDKISALITKMQNIYPATATLFQSNLYYIF